MAEKAKAANEWVGLKVSYLEQIDGVAICDFTMAQTSKDSFLDLTRQSMALIKSLDARRYRRVCRCLHYIANTALISRGQYGRTLKVCRVDYSRNFNSPYPQRNVREYAGVLIHEATHGLLFEKGIPYDKETRERVERLCHLESYRFALRFEPGYADLYPGPYNPEWHKQSWARSRQARRAVWWKRLQEAYQEYRSSNPKNARDFNQRGGANLQKRDYDKAILDYNRAIEIDPKDARIRMNRGTAYMRKFDYEKAISDYDQAIQLDPKEARVRINRGTAHIRRLEYDKAISDYDHAISLNPRDATAYKNLAWLLATCPQVAFRDGKKAVEHATKACALSEGKDPDTLKTLAAAYGEAGDFENAVKWERQFLGTPDQIAKATLNAESRLSLYQAHKRYYEVK